MRAGSIHGSKEERALPCFGVGHRFCCVNLYHPRTQAISVTPNDTNCADVRSGCAGYESLACRKARMPVPFPGRPPCLEAQKVRRRERIAQAIRSNQLSEGRPFRQRLGFRQRVACFPAQLYQQLCVARNGSTIHRSMGRAPN